MDQREYLIPRYLDAKTIARLMPTVERMVSAIAGAEGQKREAIDESLDAIVAAPADRLVVQGFKKLLLDRCKFACASGPDPVALRRDTFERAARARRELGVREAFERQAVLEAVATDHALDPAQLEDWLFADLRQNEVLLEVKSIDAAKLIARYNVALAQGVLLRATRVAIGLDGETPGRVRQLFRAARFHGLLHRVTDEGEGLYLVVIDGPFSLFSAVLD